MFLLKPDALVEISSEYKKEMFSLPIFKSQPIV